MNNFITRIFRGRDAPTNRMSDSTYSFFTTENKEGKMTNTCQCCVAEKSELIEKLEKEEANIYMSSNELNRFVEAQKMDFAYALTEIKAGRKQSHWMWYIFPQLKALGRSNLALYYGITDIDEAKEYMANPYLRENLISITKALLALDESNPSLVMGYPDDLKLRSCMTLFELAAPDVPEFGMVLDKFYDSKRDDRTLKLLEG